MSQELDLLPHHEKYQLYEIHFLRQNPFKYVFKPSHTFQGHQSQRLSTLLLLGTIKLTLMFHVQIGLYQSKYHQVDL